MSTVKLSRTVRVLWLSATVILSFVAVTGCHRSVDSETMLNYIFSEYPGCELPCWKGIIPGETEEEELFSIVAGQLNQELTVDESYPLPAGGSEYLWIDKTSDVPTKVRFEESANNPVEFISFSVGGHVHLGAIIDALGAPEFYTSDAGLAEESFFSLNLFYTDMGVVVGVYQTPYSIPNSARSPECTIEIDSDTPVRQMWLTRPGSFESLLEQLANNIPAQGQPLRWPGTGEIYLTDCDE